jgi:hypothetical protein
MADSMDVDQNAVTKPDPEPTSNEQKRFVVKKVNTIIPIRDFLDQSYIDELMMFFESYFNGDHCLFVVECRSPVGLGYHC